MNATTRTIALLSFILVLLSQAHADEISDLDEYLNSKYGISKSDFPECMDQEYARKFQPTAKKELEKSFNDSKQAEISQSVPYLDKFKQIKANGIASGVWSEEQVTNQLNAIPKLNEYKVILESRLTIKKRFADKQYGLISVEETVGANNPILLNRGTCFLIKSAIADLSGLIPINEQLWNFSLQKFTAIAQEQNVKTPN